MPRTLLLAVLLSGLLLAPAAHGARPLDLPSTESLLFSLQADAGSLQPTAARGRYVLTLRALASQGVWFSDRPARDSGAIAARQLFAAWGRLGFSARAPNAVVSITGGRERADMFAVELGRPRYDRHRRTVRFDVRALSWLSHDLAHLGPSIDRAVPRRFGKVALFIDDASYPTSGSCDIVGEADLFASPYLPAGYLAPGQTLSTRTFPVLRSVTDAQWGADDPVSFNLPAMPAASGLQYGVCVRGMYPVDPSAGGSDVDPGCTVGEVAVQLADRPIAGWSALSRLGAPPAGRWSLCARSASTAPCIVGQVALFDAPSPPANWIAADGGLVQIMSQVLLYNLITTTFGGDGEFTFATPNLPVPASGLSWGICAEGSYPTPT